MKNNKTLVIASLVMLIELALIVVPIVIACNGNQGRERKKIIERYTDERGLTSVIFTVNDKDTFGYDYLTPAELDSLFTPVPVDYFKDGQILYPDYACNDTLIVIDAKGLNKAMAYVEQDISWGSDADCDSLIHQYAIPYNK